MRITKPAPAQNEKLQEAIEDAALDLCNVMPGTAEETSIIGHRLVDFAVAIMTAVRAEHSDNTKEETK